MQEITITAQDDGTFAVSSGPTMPGAEMGGMDPSMGMPAEAQGETFDTLDEALDAVRMVLGGDDMGAAQPMMEGEEDFIAGFKGANGSQGV